MLPSYSCWTFFRPAACAASLDVCVFTTFLIFEAHSAPLSENKKDSLVCFFYDEKVSGLDLDSSYTAVTGIGRYCATKINLTTKCL